VPLQQPEYAISITYLETCGDWMFELLPFTETNIENKIGTKTKWFNGSMKRTQDITEIPRLIQEIEQSELVE
jgi:hypothetical protein